ncbi:thioredoxin family protein [Mesotoga prima]|uniref:thioredoxin family protein n=1 Tax=Mesotoga prima TaxID=1184387 RepID=UPI002CFE0259|nr:thioredoxin fold domain-containing protein [Mesotoga prima]HQC14090.1 thioredoxin fold domain-containing protein [Mesotoga prima]
MKKVVFLLVLLLPGIIFSYVGMLDDFDTALKLAKIEDKEAIVMFSDTSCVYCVKFVKETLADETVQDLLKAGFVFSQIYKSNPGKASYVVGEEWKEMSYGELYAYFQIRGTPTFWFFTSENALLNNLPGYVPAKDFTTILRFLGERAYETATFEDYRSKESTFMGEPKIVRVSEEDYNYVLQNDPIAREYKDQEVDKFTVWLTKDESTAEYLLEEGVFRVILLN